MFRLFKTIVATLVVSTTIANGPVIYTTDSTFVEPPAIVEEIVYETPAEQEKPPIPEYKLENRNIEMVKAEIFKAEPVEDEIIEEELATQEEIELLALLVMAEAEGESEYGKRLVIDTVLNRVDSEFRYFEDSITDVIWQPNQFSGMYGARIAKCYVTEDNIRLVKEELASRTNYDVLYFHAKHYGKYGTPLFNEGNHYFSGV